MPSCTLLLLLTLCSGALALKHYGGSMTFSAKGKNPDGSFKVDFRYLQTFDTFVQTSFWNCLKGNCGTVNRFEIGEVDGGINGTSSSDNIWCQSAALLTRNIPTNKPFQMWNWGTFWIQNYVGNYVPWKLLTHVDLGTRSDTREPNSSPVTASLPFIRVPQNCDRTFKLLAHDPDQDRVRCRYGNARAKECFSCRQHSGFYLNPNSCTLSYWPTNNLDGHAFEIVLEDFPRQIITLSYTDGTRTTRSPFMRVDKREAPMPTADPWTTTTTPDPWTTTRTTTPDPWTITPAMTKIRDPWTTTRTTTTAMTTTAITPVFDPWYILMHLPMTTTTTTADPWTTTTTTPDPWTITPAMTKTREPWTTTRTTTPDPWTTTRTTTPDPWTTTRTTTPDPWTITPAMTKTREPWTTPRTTTTAMTTTTTTPIFDPWSILMPIPLSKIPLQFVIQVDPPVDSCTEGRVLPRFLYPTPRNGETLNAQVTRELEIRLNATATQSSVQNFIISGPLNITKYNTIKGSFGESLIRWTPTENDLGDHVPICFIAESRSESRIYHSEMRCIIVNVTRAVGKAHVVCKETTMTVEVEKASVAGLHEDHLRLNDPSCTPISNSTHVIAAMSLSSCGTEVEEDADNLIFKNQLMSFDKLGDVITRKHQVEIGFSCTYPKKGRVSLEFRAHKIPYVFTEKGFGKFTYQFEFFNSRLFSSMVNPESYPIEVELNELLYVEINATSSLPNTELFVESCRATPVDDPNYPIFYDIFNNGCKVDDTVEIYSSKPTEFKFGIEAFQFIGEHEEVFISCSVILCAAGDPYTRCSQGCINATASPFDHHQHKRAVATETVRHSISQGPLRIKKTTDITVSNMGLNMNLVFISAVLLVVVVIVCGAVIYIKKKSNFKYQQLPSTD